MRKNQPIPFAQKFPNVDPLVLKLLERLLAFDPKNRPTAEEEFGMEETNSTSVEFGMGELSAIGSEIVVNTVNAPKPLLGMKFNSYEEAYNYYNSYALLMGFGIRKSTINYSRKIREVVDRKFVCDKEGYRSNRDKVDHSFRCETRVRYKAMMRVKLLEDKSWEVTGFVEEHTNHVLSSPDKAKMHRSHQ